MDRKISNLQKLYQKLGQLAVYRNIREDPVIQKLSSLSRVYATVSTTETLQPLYYDFVHTLIEQAEDLGLSGNVYRKYIAYILLNDINPFSLACETHKATRHSTLFLMAFKEMDTMRMMMDIDMECLGHSLSDDTSWNNYVPIASSDRNFIDKLERVQSKGELLDTLVWYYQNIGCGTIGIHRMLRYNKRDGLTGIKNYDPITFSDIVGYEQQKKALINNTEAFLQGYPANNVLLVGARGTGKSSCVKALANMYSSQGLRLLELNSEQLKDIPHILPLIEDRGKHFIIFIDDLSFDECQTQYKYIKSVLEGSAGARPQNVRFYATSNRRHIIQEKWSDKQEATQNDEIHTTDTVNEKLSLSDRFGLTLTFLKPNQEEFLNIVQIMAKKAKIALPDELLRERAIQWEMNQKGLSGRTARQFINAIVWEMENNEYF